MALRCPSCRQTHPDLARFCGRCGRSLPRAPAGPTLKPIPSRRPAGGTSFCGWMFFFLCTLAFWGVWLTTGQRCQRRCFDLPSPQCSALYELLEPDDVAVEVSRPDYSGRLIIQGTNEEVAAVERFARLLEGKRTGRRFRSAVDEARTYRLRTDKAEALAAVLQRCAAAVDVAPLAESRGRTPLAVTAAPEDHRAIEGMVRILDGS